MKGSKKRIQRIIIIIVVLFCGFLVYRLIKNTSNTKISDECFEWELPSGLVIKRYNKCSSLNLEKFTDGREIKANFVLTRPIVVGIKDSFPGEPETATVDGNSITRYKNDSRNNDSGLGNYHIDYSINYDRIPMKTEKPGGRTLMTAEFTLSTKDSSHASDQEVEEFMKLTDAVMDALVTK